MVAEGTYKPDQGAGKTLGDREQWFILVNGVRYYGGFLGNEITRCRCGDANKTILSGEIVAVLPFELICWKTLMATRLSMDFRLPKEMHRCELCKW